MSRSPPIRKLTRRVVTLRSRIDALVEGNVNWIRYADARVDLEVLRQELAFNVGVEVGAILARAERARGGRGRSSQGTVEERELRVRTSKLLLATRIPAASRVAILLDLASALLEELPTASMLLASLRGSRARVSRSAMRRRPPK